MIELHAKQGRIDIRVRAIYMGDDICILIDGGDKPHMGAVSIAYDNYTKHQNTLIIPNHKEDIISKEVAKLVYDTLGRATCCICGIHINNITKDEITQVLVITRELILTLLEQLKK